MDLGDYGPEVKRKKTFSKKEALEKLKKCEDNVAKTVEMMLTELSPFDVTDEDVINFEDRVERLGKVSSSLSSKIYRLKQDIKAKKFKRKPELLEEDIISCSQFSVLQLQDLQDISESFSQHSLQEEKEEEVGSRPSTYRKQPLNKPMSQRSRCRQVEAKREILEQLP